MFDNIQLFTKRDNIIEEPNSSWTAKTNIHCTLDLNLGFGMEKEVWTHGNSVRLIHIIDFHKQLRNWIISPKEYLVLEITNDSKIFVFEWTQNDTFGFKVSLGVRSKYNKPAIPLLEKYFGLLKIIEFQESFFFNLLTILSEQTNDDLSIFWGELFFDKNNNAKYEFNIGQRVKTITGDNVKTERIGIVVNKSYHDKNKTTMYQILTDGKKLDKRYLPTDFVSAK